MDTPFAFATDGFRHRRKRVFGGRTTSARFGYPWGFDVGIDTMPQDMLDLLRLGQCTDRCAHTAEAVEIRVENGGHGSSFNVIRERILVQDHLASERRQGCPRLPS
jgi:hypothetical protein